MLVAGCPPSLCHRTSLSVTSLSSLSWVFSAFFSGYHSLHCCQTYLNNLFTCHIELFLYLILTNDKCVVSPMSIRILSVHEMCKQLSGQQIRLSLPRCPVFETIIFSGGPTRMRQRNHSSKHPITLVLFYPMKQTA